MSKKVVLFFVFLCLATASWAQETVGEEEPEEERERWQDRVFFGGGGGLQFSNVGTFVAVMPSVGYRITPKFSAGIIGNYQYVHYRNFDRSVHNYGGSLFARYLVFPQIFAAAEYELMNMNILRTTQEGERLWIDRALVGAGYFQSGGGNAGFYLAVLYDLFYSNSLTYPYQSPIVYRVGFTF